MDGGGSVIILVLLCHHMPREFPLERQAANPRAPLKLLQDRLTKLFVCQWGSASAYLFTCPVEEYLVTGVTNPLADSYGQQVEVPLRQSLAQTSPPP